MGELNPLETLEEEMTLNLRRLHEEPQERYPVDDVRKYRRGTLINPAAQIFEARLNKAAESYYDLLLMMGNAALLGEAA